MAVASRGRIVVVGGGPAAAASAVALRERGHDGELILLSDEQRPPYSRPPLSKAFLRGEVAPGDLALGIADAEFRGGVRARRVDFGARRVELAGGEMLPYDGLVLATGLRARRPAAPGIEVLATLEDAERISARLRTARTALIIGSGFLAYELASTAHRAGCETVLVTRPGALRARFGLVEGVLAARAVAAGVRLVHASACEFRDAFVVADGARLEADLVIAAIGSAFEAGLAPGTDAGGAVIDAHCRVRDGVVAAGDAALTRTASGGLRRDATWTNALAQAAAAAHALLDDGAPAYAPVPYAWTEAFGLEVKIAGAPPVGVEAEVVDGSLDEDRALLRWPGGAGAIGYRIPVARLKVLASAEPATLDS